MINHIVLMAMSEDIGEADTLRMSELVEAIREEVGEVRSYEMVRNIAPDASYNWAILSSFDSVEDIAVYKVAPLHLELVALTAIYATDFLTLDYES